MKIFKKSPDPQQCSYCSSVEFLEEWAGRKARCDKCGRHEIVHRPDRDWYSTVVGGEALKRMDDHARETARVVIQQISGETTPCVWIVNFTSSQAVHRFASTIEGARMVGVLPHGTVVLRLVGSSPKNWEDYKKGALLALRGFKGQPGTPSMVAAATDSPRDFRSTVERLKNVRGRLRCIGYQD